MPKGLSPETEAAIRQLADSNEGLSIRLMRDKLLEQGYHVARHTISRVIKNESKLKYAIAHGQPRPRKPYKTSKRTEELILKVTEMNQQTIPPSMRQMSKILKVSTNTIRRILQDLKAPDETSAVVKSPEDEIFHSVLITFRSGLEEFVNLNLEKIQCSLNSTWIEILNMNEVENIDMEQHFIRSRTGKGTASMNEQVSEYLLQIQRYPIYTVHIDRRDRFLKTLKKKSEFDVIPVVINEDNNSNRRRSGRVALQSHPPKKVYIDNEICSSTSESSDEDGIHSDNFYSDSSFSGTDTVHRHDRNNKSNTSHTTQELSESVVDMECDALNIVCEPLITFSSSRMMEDNDSLKIIGKGTMKQISNEDVFRIKSELQTLKRRGRLLNLFSQAAPTTAKMLELIFGEA